MLDELYRRVINCKRLPNVIDNRMISMRTVILLTFFVVISSLNAAYINEIYPPSAASGAIVSNNEETTYINYVVVGEITGPVTSTVYINRIGALPPLPPPTTTPVPPFSNIVQIQIAEGAENIELLLSSEQIALVGTVLAIVSYAFMVRTKMGN